MELPIASHNAHRSAEALVRAIKRSDVILSRTIAEETQLDGATVFTNPERPQVHLANCAFDLSIPDDSTAKAVVDPIMNHFQETGVHCHALQSASLDWSEELTQVLTALEYQTKTYHVLLLDAYMPPRETNSDLQIIPIRAAYSEARRIYDLQAKAESNADEALARELTNAHIDHLDEPRLEVFLGRLGGPPVAVAGVITLGNIGVIDPAFTDPDHRGSGLGRTLMAHVLEHCQRALFESVIVRRSDGCWSIPFYESLGFKGIASLGSFKRGRV